LCGVTHDTAVFNIDVRVVIVNENTSSIIASFIVTAGRRKREKQIERGKSEE
jgi:hypothetical protein